MEAVYCSSALSLWSRSAAGTQAKVSSMVSMGKRGTAQSFKSFFYLVQFNFIPFHSK